MPVQHATAPRLEGQAAADANTGRFAKRAAPLLDPFKNPTDEMRTGAQLRAPTHWSAAVFKVSSVVVNVGGQKSHRMDPWANRFP